MYCCHTELHLFIAQTTVTPNQQSFLDVLVSGNVNASILSVLYELIFGILNWNFGILKSQLFTAYKLSITKYLLKHRYVLCDYELYKVKLYILT